MTQWTVRYLGRVDNYPYADVCPSDCKLAMVSLPIGSAPVQGAIPKLTATWGFVSMDRHNPMPNGPSACLRPFHCSSEPGTPPRSTGGTSGTPPLGVVLWACFRDQAQHSGPEVPKPLLAVYDSIASRNGASTKLSRRFEEGVHTVVDDAAAARKQLLANGVEASEVDVQPWGHFVHFSDPDGNTWSLQPIVRPG